MSIYLREDLTGKDPTYYSDNNTRAVWSTNQRILFHKAVFEDSLKIVILNSSVPTPLIRGIDWDILDEDIDYDSKSRIMVKDITFNKTLVKSVTILKYVDPGAPIIINSMFQMLYPLHSEQYLYHNEPVEFTPDDWIEIVEQIKYLRLLTSPVQDVTTLEGRKPQLLEPDPTRTNVNNKIYLEEHNINVPGNICVIHPVCGSFFKGSVKLVQKSNKYELKEGEDYVLFSPDFDKIKISGEPDKLGVYQFILVKKAITGTLLLDYHAFGGDVTMYDQRAIDDRLMNIIKFLNDSKFLTPENIGSVDIFSQLNNRVKKVEEKMRRLTKDGVANYGDVSYKSSVVKKLRTADTDLHWWSIATLYQVAGSNDIITADRAHFRFQTDVSGLMFDAMISVNLNNPINKFDIDILSDIYPKCYEPFISYNIDDLTYPQFRIIWNENTVQTSGIILQIGMELKVAAVETIAIEDLSGRESAWKLIPEISGVVEPEDDVISLPAEHHTWSTLNSDSRYESMLIPFTEGHLIWAGTISLNRPDDGWKSFKLDHYLPKDINLSKLKRLRLEFMEEGGNKLCGYVELVPDPIKSMGPCVLVYQSQPVYITAVLISDVTNGISIDMTANVKAGSASNRLDLRHVFVYS